jgi:hypothetical protein
MAGPQQFGLACATVAGGFMPLLHTVCAWLTLREGWRRGYLREGLLHGMLLGLPGLLSVLLLKRQRRVTEALHTQYARIGTDPYHALFYCAWGLLYAALGLGYGALAYRWAVPTAAIAPPVLITAGIALALGLALYSLALPPSRWIPQPGDYAEYPEDPALCACLRFDHLSGIYRQQANNSRALIATLCCVCAVSAITCATFAAGAQDPNSIRVEAVSALVALVAAALCVPLYRRKLRAEAQLVQHNIDGAGDDPDWLPVIPVALRQEALRLEARIKALRLQAQWRLFQLGVSGAAALGILGGVSAAVALCPPLWSAAAAAGGALLAAGLWRALRGVLARRSELRWELAEQLQLERALVSRIRVLVDSYENEQRCIELAFRHEALPDTLLSRSVRLPGRAPWEEPAPAGATGAGDDAAAEGDDECAAEEDAAADSMDQAGGALAARAAPRIAPWLGATRMPHPQRSRLLRLAGAYFGMAVLAVLLTAPASNIDQTYTLQGLLVLATAGLLVISLGLWLRALLYPETLVLPTPPPPAPEDSATPEAPPEDDAMPAGGEACGITEGEAQPEECADAFEGEDPASGTAAALRQQQQLDRLLQLDQRLAQRGAAQGALFYVSLLFPGGLAGLYLTYGIIPPAWLACTALVWLAIAAPAFAFVARSSAGLYWRRMQSHAGMQATDVWRCAVANEESLLAWRRTARNRLRLAWLSCGLTYATLVCGGYWCAGVRPGPQPVPTAHWAVAALCCAAAAAYFDWAFTKARAEMQRWRYSWLESMKRVQRQQYLDVLALRSRAEVLEVHDGFQVVYTPPDVDDAQVAQWVERDFAHAAQRDPLELWLERARSLALAGAAAALMTFLPQVDFKTYTDLGDIALFLCALFLLLALLFWLGRRWRLRLVRGG